MVPRENKNNAYAKFGGGGGEQRVLWYFRKWPIMGFEKVENSKLLNFRF